MKKNTEKRKGFTLVETLVAISILSLSILAGFTAVQNGLKSSQTAKNQIIAFYMVQEAMEYIKNIRDENALDFINGGTKTWLTGLSAGTDPCDIGEYCRIDSPAKVVTYCGMTNTSCPNIGMDTSTGVWGYAYPVTNFNRAISITPVVAGQEVVVTVRISWTQGNSTQTFQVSQSLFNRLQ